MNNSEIRFCRLCLSKTELNSDYLIDIFSEQGNEFNIKNILLKHFWFDVSTFFYFSNIEFKLKILRLKRTTHIQITFV